MPRLILSTILILQSLLLASAQEVLPLKSGAERFDEYLHLLEGRKLGLVAHHCSVVGESHLVDTLLARGISSDQILRVFGPEHGFRGDRAAGVHVEDGRDARTGIAVVSLYGPNKKPSPESLEGIELILLDLQDVPEMSAGLRIERVSYLKTGKVVEFTRSVYRADAYDFVAELRISEDPS